MAVAGERDDIADAIGRAVDVAGGGVVADARRLRALVADLVGAPGSYHRTEIDAVVAVADVLRDGGSTDEGRAVTALRARGFDPGDATWAVETMAAHGAGIEPEPSRGGGGGLPGWARSRTAMAAAAVAILVPVVVLLLPDPEPEPDVGSDDVVPEDTTTSAARDDPDEGGTDTTSTPAPSSPTRNPTKPPCGPGMATGGPASTG